MTTFQRSTMAIGAGRGLCACSIVVSLWVSGCTGTHETGSVARGPTLAVSSRQAAQPWVLIRNPRFGDVRGEREYIWVEEDQIPTTLRTVLFGQKSMIAPPDVVPTYGSPPDGGVISRLHNSPVAAPEPGATAPAIPPREIKTDMHRMAPAATAQVSARGYVVLVKKTRILVDLTDKDGLQPGSMLSIRQPLAVVHPVSGQLLGTYEDEVATARVVEIHGMFSVAEMEEVFPGVEIKLKDRVVPRARQP